MAVTQRRARRAPNRDGLIQCADPPTGCGQWKQANEFASRQRRSPNGTVWQYDPICRGCQLRQRVNRKDADPALWIVESRGRALATRIRQAGGPEYVTVHWLMDRCRWSTLPQKVRPLLEDHAECSCPDYEFRGQPDIHLDHMEPPYDWGKDLAAHHARNIQALCGTCNGRKNNKPLRQWIDEAWSLDEDYFRRTRDGAYVPAVVESSQPTQLQMVCTEQFVIRYPEQPTFDFA